MESELDKYYKEYEIINAIIKEKQETIDELYKNLIKTKVGKFYFSLNDKQKKEFREIYSDINIIIYFLNKKSIEVYKKALKDLFSSLVNSSSFTLNKESSLNIYIKDGIDTYNVLTNKSTKDIDITDEIKLFIQEAINDIYGISSNFSLDDIPLIKAIYYKINKEPTNKNCSKIIETRILSQAERIHRLIKRKKAL